MAVESPAAFARRTKLKGTAFRDAYWEYRASIGQPVPGSPQAAKTVTTPAVGNPRPGPVPGTLDARGEDEMAAADQAYTDDQADIEARETADRLAWEDSTRRAETDLTENVRRNTARFGARGLLRSGLRAGGEAQVQANHVDLMTALGRRWSDAQSAATRARTRLEHGYGATKAGISRSAWDRLFAEFQANGGSTVTPGTTTTTPGAAPPVKKPTSRPPSATGTDPRRTGTPPKTARPAGALAGRGPAKARRPRGPASPGLRGW